VNEGCANKIIPKGEKQPHTEAKQIMMVIVEADQTEKLEKDSAKVADLTKGMKCVFQWGVKDKDVKVEAGTAWTEKEPAESVLRAWFGDETAKFTDKKVSGGCCGKPSPAGIDVTAEVKKLLAAGGTVEAKAEAFKDGGLLPKKKKFPLIIEIGKTDTKKVTFHSQPVDMHFKKGGSPLEVLGFSSDDSKAKAKGIQPGWILQTLEGEDLSQLSHEAAFEQVKVFMTRLPKDIQDMKNKVFRVRQTIKIGKGDKAGEGLIVTEADDTIAYKGGDDNPSVAGEFTQDDVAAMEIEITRDAPPPGE